jgi:hypothetical protein
MAAASDDVVVALASFVAAVNGADVVVNEGHVYRKNDPLVKKFPQFFAAQGVRESGPRIEAATAAPGEKR